jgi:short-subunit dehydrogenase
MTENLDLPKKLTAQPAEVAEKIALAVKKSRNVIYVRSIWFLIMTIICNIPENIFKKMKL